MQMQPIIFELRFAILGSLALEVRWFCLRRYATHGPITFFCILSEWGWDSDTTLITNIIMKLYNCILCMSIGWPQYHNCLSQHPPWIVHEEGKGNGKGKGYDAILHYVVSMLVRKTLRIMASLLHRFPSTKSWTYGVTIPMHFTFTRVINKV